jgi:hypothetical protein
LKRGEDKTIWFEEESSAICHWLKHRRDFNGKLSPENYLHEANKLVLKENIHCEDCKSLEQHCEKLKSHFWFYKKKIQKNFALKHLTIVSNSTKIFCVSYGRTNQLF